MRLRRVSGTLQQVLPPRGTSERACFLALVHLYNRMETVALQHMNTAILLARETGGNLPTIFERISNTMREVKKVDQKIDTLTVQGKLQSVIMTLLPIGFCFYLYNFNNDLFMTLLDNSRGRILLVYCFVCNNKPCK